MELIALTCNQCGAPLEVPVTANFLTCTYCKTRLKVHNQGGAAFTETIDSIDQRTRVIAEDVDAIRAHHDLEHLDKEWATLRDRFKNDAGLIVSSTRGAFVGMVITLLIVGVLLFFVIRSIDLPIIVTVLFAIVYPVVAGLVGLGAYANAREFEKEFRTYHQRRSDIMKRLGTGP